MDYLVCLEEGEAHRDAADACGSDPYASPSHGPRLEHVEEHVGGEADRPAAAADGSEPDVQEARATLERKLCSPHPHEGSGPWLDYLVCLEEGEAHRDAADACGSEPNAQLSHGPRLDRLARPVGGESDREAAASSGSQPDEVARAVAGLSRVVMVLGVPGGQKGGVRRSRSSGGKAFGNRVGPEGVADCREGGGGARCRG